MASEFNDLNEVLKKIITPKIIEQQVNQESAIRRYMQDRVAKKPMTGEKFVQVQTPDGPMVIDYVTDVNYLDNGGLEVCAVHEGNVTIECFPPGQWTHCTTKQVAPAQEEEPKMSIPNKLIGSLRDDGIDALAQQFYGKGNWK